jgi:hypothetical protein
VHAYTERKAQCPPASSRLLLVPPGPASSSRRSCRRCVRSSPHGRRRGQPRAVSELARVRPEPGHARLAAVRLHRRRDRSSHLVLLVVPRDHLRTAARPVGRRTARVPWQGAGRRGAGQATPSYSRIASRMRPSASIWWQVSEGRPPDVADQGQQVGPGVPGFWWWNGCHGRSSRQGFDRGLALVFSAPGEAALLI